MVTDIFKLVTDEWVHFYKIGLYISLYITYFKIFLQLQIHVQVHCVKVTTSVSMATGLIPVTALNGGLDAAAQVANLVSLVSSTFFSDFVSNYTVASILY